MQIFLNEFLFGGRGEGIGARGRGEGEEGERGEGDAHAVNQVTASEFGEVEEKAEKEFIVLVLMC